MLRARMTHRALIERATQSVDAYGNALPPTWATHVASQACYLYEPRVSAEQQGERNFNLYGFEMLVPLDVDITEQDRVNGVYDRRGQTVCASVLNVLAVVRKPDHQHVVLEAVT